MAEDYLAHCAQLDVKQWLENKLLEHKFGYWEKQGEAPSYYSDRFYGPHDRDFSEWGRVEYFYDDKIVTRLPKLDEMKRPYMRSQLCRMIINGIPYRFVFPNPNSPPGDYAMLYAMFCQTRR
jgi:hypothetical protein